MAEMSTTGSACEPQIQSTPKLRKHLGRSNLTSDSQLLGPEDKIGEGDSKLALDVLPPQLAETAFEKLKAEVKWNVMHHRGGEVPRLVAVEGEVNEDGSFPIYRHPADESPPLLPFSPAVSLIRDHVQAALGGQPVNHVLIQLYRSGADYISEHADKTVDVVKGSAVVNVSLGARRIMVLRTKRGYKPPGISESNVSLANVEADGADAGRITQRIPLPHNSMFILGLDTNKRWLHGIRTDKRPPQTKSTDELSFAGERISLTFRHIGTLLTRGETHVFGQGAKGKTREEAREVVNGGEETERLIVAFGEENQRWEFGWEEAYGEGFDVLHFVEAR